MVVELPNVQSIIFKEHEGSFLVGMLAAMKSRTGKVGFVGGMDIPLIRKFALGYKEGAQYVNKDVEVFQNMIGTTPAAWGDPIKAGELARSQFDRDADVIFTAAGGSGMGVLQAAADLKKFSIGVDSNQNYIHPGSVLTSMVKRVDLAVYEAMRDAKAGSWKPGLKLLGLAEGGVDYALDKYNAALITDEMKAKVDAAKADIISGKIKVTNYFDIMDQ
jgi:basic membrane protein A